MSEVKLYLGDCLDILPTLEAGSVDAVITDPPYDGDSVPLYGQLAKHAQRLLKQSGTFSVMSGQSYLPQVMDEIGQYLLYRWTMAFVMLSGQAVQIWPRKVIAFWKPLLVYSNYEHPNAWFGDVVKNPRNDGKDLHKWQQGEIGISDWIDRLTNTGDIVVDPMMGSGTTGVACVQAGRNFIGIEIDPGYFEIAKTRIEKAQAEMIQGAFA